MFGPAQIIADGINNVLQHSQNIYNPKSKSLDLSLLYQCMTPK